MERKIILHRGYKGKYPENSKIAFENALKQGFSFETDIRVSKDGIVYLIHDESLNRLFNGTGKISELSSEKLTKFRYKEDSSQNMFELRDLCELMRIMNYNNLVFIHIKELKDLDKVIGILKKYNFQKNIRFFAVDELTLDLISLIKKRYPGYKVGLHFNDSSAINEADFSSADFIWADEINKENITQELVDFSHKLGKPIYVISPELIPESIFNINIKKRWKEFLEMNVNGICTDLPKEFLSFIKED